MTVAEEGAASGPLAGVRVVELAGIGPGPFAAMVLADLGADVVRVDRPGGAGGLRIDPDYDLANRNKRSVLIDLKADGGTAVVLDLVERADILIEGYRPGVAEKLGLGPDDCLARNPKLVYGRMTGWGQEGPLARTAGHDIGYIAVTGALSMIGAADGPPVAPVNLLGDYAGGSLYLVIGLLAALHHARAGGSGQVVDAAIVDGTAHLTAVTHGMMAAGGWRDQRGTNLLDGGCPFYGTYETADGGYMAVGPLERKFYTEFIELLGIVDKAPARDDFDSWTALRDAIADRFKERTREEWTAVFGASDACVAPVLSLREAPSHPQLAARSTFLDHGGITQPAPAPRFSATPGAVRRAPARPGADADEVARDWGVTSLIEGNPS
ncbi:CaiB/BaiF CoA transferase family protein [Streptomyces rapamycinicus]|uniref:L-carnitine dehydratase n=1 Tax=Streptomyces rapamycinicus (strain ATCC 29253 / DSM 41530 / NRRL 5491 / AYB-994) TaxID=1343740 RepID=A0A0A0NHL2_STRRN|nr:CaiB/BaiF CoA-transferase family protein [Streptomyces rapamycinicus]AGP53880.1 L-carnitine dehydratase [Streptomyces rapamycinicus NRRL 5491]RLV73985.1 L-carnitine dehydratase [Streptomyces rapamycinicus NRRL 5491]UTO61994.1 CoA transferase [Streptomyces rapamycinicus]UTP29946.1 CoA transferase [Streptomyces rapamycinicus NRRL 5491]